jgi:hypothetical protein
VRSPSWGHVFSQKADIMDISGILCLHSRVVPCYIPLITQLLSQWAPHEGTFVEVDREILYLLPPSIQDWLPEKHLARLVVEMVV